MVRRIDWRSSVGTLHLMYSLNLAKMRSCMSSNRIEARQFDHLTMVKEGRVVVAVSSTCKHA